MFNITSIRGRSGNRGEGAWCSRFKWKLYKNNIFIKEWYILSMKELNQEDGIRFIEIMVNYLYDMKDKLIAKGSAKQKNCIR